MDHGAFRVITFRQQLPPTSSSNVHEKIHSPLFEKANTVATVPPNLMPIMPHKTNSKFKHWKSTNAVCKDKYISQRFPDFSSSPIYHQLPIFSRFSRMVVTPYIVADHALQHLWAHAAVTHWHGTHVCVYYTITVEDNDSVTEIRFIIVLSRHNNLPHVYITCFQAILTELRVYAQPSTK